MIFVLDHKWPRLFMCDKWHKYINYDPDHIDHKHLDFWLRGTLISKVLLTKLSFNSYFMFHSCRNEQV